VLLRGGRRDTELLLADVDAVGDGVEEGILVTRSPCLIPVDANKE
jgi:hypothetical protein